jgi:aryl-alcohol dehydrogenase-like predicted oxidoreductase
MMKMIKLGRSGLDVSPLCLGCMTFGAPDQGAHKWTFDEEKSRPIIRHALDRGINFFDTANSYSAGTSEEIVGRMLSSYAPRDEIVIATKVYFNDQNGPNRVGLSRKAIMREVDASLARLKTDYIDLYQIHRWDPTTPIEETLEALHDVVKAGKVRYLGASSMYAWQFSKALYTADLNGWTRFITMQDHLNLLNREEEREMLPLCLDQEIGVLAWSPLARGRLTRDWNQSTDRMESDLYGKALYASTDEADRRVVECVSKIASERGVPRAQVALAWVAQHAAVSAPIIGASKPQHIDDAIAALSIRLTSEEIAVLESAYVPHPVVGFE